MLSRFRIHLPVLLALALLCAFTTHAQTTSDESDEGADEAVQLFHQGQDAHASGDLARALELYERAIKLRPEFPEAEYQRASALVTLNRVPEAEKGFRRAIELQPDWTLPLLTLGKLLGRAGRAAEAEDLLRRAYEIDEDSAVALVALADLHLHTKAPREKLLALLRDLKTATEADDSNAGLWAARASIERALSEKTAALASLDRALLGENKSANTIMERAELRAESGDYDGALTDARAAQRDPQQSTRATLLVARIYAQAGKPDEALKTLDTLDASSKNLPEAVSLRASLAKDCGDSSDENIAATEALLKLNPRDAGVMACLGAALRTKNPTRSLELFRAAAEQEPSNVRHATGYAAALVQARRFNEAAIVLRRILAVEPENFTAHTNLATALYELKNFPAALAEFEWLLGKKPDLVVAYYFIATAHDFLGEYAEALAAYETFLARANAQQNQLEIDKVNLRLPTLRNQVRRGEGKKSRKSKS
ncbi:MAG TPA: tetratricopeptide repeat protein [Pyrinomonadaceae bacterium]|nr:tetratricopeptide repeat protein [Pyrinomonadaceae bacterium]